MRKIYIKYILKKRNITIIIGIFLSVIMMFSLIRIGTSILNQYNEMAMGGLCYDISVSNISNEQIEYMQKNEKADYYIEENVCTAVCEGYDDGMIIAYSASDMDKCVKLQAGEYPDSENEILMIQ